MTDVTFSIKLMEENTLAMSYNRLTFAAKQLPDKSISD